MKVALVMILVLFITAGVATELEGYGRLSPKVGYLQKGIRSEEGDTSIAWCPGGMVGVSYDIAVDLVWWKRVKYVNDLDNMALLNLDILYKSYEGDSPVLAVDWGIDIPIIPVRVGRIFFFPRLVYESKMYPDVRTNELSIEIQIDTIDKSAWINLFGVDLDKEK